MVVDVDDEGSSVSDGDGDGGSVDKCDKHRRRRRTRTDGRGQQPRTSGRLGHPVRHPCIHAIQEVHPDLLKTLLDLRVVPILDYATQGDHVITAGQSTRGQRQRAVKRGRFTVACQRLRGDQGHAQLIAGSSRRVGQRGSSDSGQLNARVTATRTAQPTLGAHHSSSTQRLTHSPM